MSSSTWQGVVGGGIGGPALPTYHEEWKAGVGRTQELASVTFLLELFSRCLSLPDMGSVLVFSTWP